MIWTVLVPLKPPGERKTRLAGVLSIDQCDALADQLFRHVTSVLRQTPIIGRMILLSAQPTIGGAIEWICDKGEGLNEALEVARVTLGTVPLIVLHPDLPLLNVMDITMLADAGLGGCAIAPDRHGTGTNAIALAPGHVFRFAFGAASLAAHRAQGSHALVDREGLVLDLDTPEDLAALRARRVAHPIAQRYSV